MDPDGSRKAAMHEVRSERGGSSVVLPLMTCDEAVCREVLDV